MSIEKRPFDYPTLEVRPNGVLSGHTFVMAEPTAEMYLALRAGTLSDPQLMEAVLEAVTDSSIEGPLEKLPALSIIAIGIEWTEVWQANAFPPRTGGSSEVISSPELSEESPVEQAPA